MDYRVELENFAGPLDLLLYLIRKEEIEIHDIPISRVLDQYLAYVKLIESLDLDEVGEFLVLAATLMVIKSKMLLPAEHVDLEQEIDPRYGLVQQLLEYKRFKDQCSDLERRARTFAKMAGRPDSARPEGPVKEDRSLDEVTLFDLLQLFGKLMDETAGGGRRERTIKVDDTPVRVYATRLTERLKADSSILFSDLVKKEAPRQEKIGWFLALLLLLKNETAGCAQDGAFGDIRIFFRGEIAAGAEEAGADDFRP
jgi:segregation and condensation protein A